MPTADYAYTNPIYFRNRTNSNQPTNFVNDLGADSLDLVELFNALEEAFNIEIHNKVNGMLLTVEQTIDFISQKIESPILL